MMDRNRGFTLVEMVVVVVLVSILAMVGMSRFFGRVSFDEWGYSDELGTALRHARRLAVTSGCDTRILIDNSGFRLNQRASCDSGSFSQPVILPAGDGSGYSGSTPGGVTVTGADLYFDPAGRPRDPASDALLSGVTPIGIGSRMLNVEPQTGYVHRP